LGAALISALLDRFPLLIWAGAALLGWIAGDIIATDRVVSAYLIADFGETFARQAAIATACAGALLVIAVGAVLRRGNKSGARQA
jgi:predicted tellurium resistance membrane protein TerC